MLQRFRHPLLIQATLAVFIVGFATYITYSPSMFVVGPTADELWPGTATWADRQLASMTLEEKVSQLFSARAQGSFSGTDDPEYKKLVDLVERFGIGGITFFQGVPLEQAALSNDLQSRAAIPLLISKDLESGSNMALEYGTTFPPTMALGATRDRELAYLAGFVTGREARAIGTHHVFAPVADVNNNPNNPTINIRSFGENPDLVSGMAIEFSRGIQEAGAIATAKHFPGRGDMATDSETNLPMLRFGMDRLETLELIPFQRLIDAGIMSVMIGHLGLPDVAEMGNLPATLSPRITTGLLRERLGFDGIVVTDELDSRGITSMYSAGELAVRALSAGADLLLLSEDPYGAREAILHAVGDGLISERRIDESVGRLLRAKAWLRLDDSRQIDLETARHTVAAQNHRALNATIVRRSLTLLRNEGGVLPVREGSRVLSVTLNDGADPSVGSDFAFQLQARLRKGVVDRRLIDDQSEPDDHASVLDEAGEYDVIVVSAFGDVGSLGGRVNRASRHVEFLDRLTSGSTPVVLVSFGNPYLPAGLTQPAAYMAAYGATEASQQAVAEALVGQTAVSGRLPIQIPDLYEFGDGIDLPQRFLRAGYPADVGLSDVQLARTDSIIYSAIADRAFPGAALAVGRGGVVTKLTGYGFHTYDKREPVTSQSIFDLASLTKVVATTTAAMKLYDEGRIDLDDRIVDYLPEFGRSGKERITIRHLLTHSAGFIPYRSFHHLGVTTRRGVIDAIMAEELVYTLGRESRYSDFSMITLMLVIEEITGQPFAEYTRETIFEPLGMHDTGFRGTGTTDPAVVPTEADFGFRGRLIQGEVHDETAWILGGVAGHAGLFSTAEDLAKFAYMVVNDGRVDGQQFLAPETIRLFTRAQRPDLSTRALGWDTKPPRGYTSAGERFGPNSFGHTGFTGTSMWIDPDVDMFVILLTNRIYPTRRNDKIVRVRPRIADLAHGAILGPPTFDFGRLDPIGQP